MKFYSNNGQEALLYFWRDQHGHEVDLVIDKGLHLELFEIKSSMIFQKEYFKNIDWLNKRQGRLTSFSAEQRIQAHQRQFYPPSPPPVLTFKE